MDSSASSEAQTPSSPSIAFYPFRGELRFPRNNREYYLSRELEERGWSIHWLRPTSADDSEFDLDWPSIDLAELDYRGHRYFYPLYLALKLRVSNIDVLWLSGWTIRNLQKLRWTIGAAHAAGVRVVYDPIDPICEYLHAQTDGDRESLRRCNQKAQKVYAASDLVTCLTPQLKDLLIEHGAPEASLMVARWATDAARFDPDVVECNFKDRLGLTEDTFLAGWLGTMDPFKGLEEVIVPLARRFADRAPEIHFVVAGKGPLRSKLQDWSEEHPDVPLTVLSRIPYEEAPNFTGSLDAFLVPTDTRTPFGRSICPIKCYDALAMGTKQITTETRGTHCLQEFPELVTLVEDKVEAFSDALLDVYRSGQAVAPARKAVEERYSHQSVSVDLADAIEQLVDATS